MGGYNANVAQAAVQRRLGKTTTAQPLDPGVATTQDDSTAPAALPPPPPPPADANPSADPYAGYTPHTSNSKNPDGSFASVNGWVDSKLQDVNHNDPKYDFMRYAQNMGATGGGLGTHGDRASMAKDLPIIVQQLKDYGGYKNVKMVGDDSIDFGDGNGPIDVLSGDGAWWWSGNQNSMSQGTGGTGGTGGGGTSPGGAPDPLGDAINQKLIDLINHNGYLGNNDEALNLENVRSAADRGRAAEYSGAMSQLANRGLLPENTPGGQGGLALDALGRIERNDIAPLMQAGVRDYQLHRSDQANENLKSALGMGTDRQGMLSDVAIKTLAQNQQFSEFLATFGLQREQVLYELQHGGNDALMQLLMLFLQQNKSGNSGHA